MKRTGTLKAFVLIMITLLLLSLVLGSCINSCSSSQSSSSSSASSSSHSDTSSSYRYTSIPTFEFSLPDAFEFSQPGTDDNDHTNAHLIVYITETGEKYHRSGCQYLRKSKIPISLEDAVSQGYSRCSKCNPPRLY